MVRFWVIHTIVLHVLPAIPTVESDGAFDHNNTNFPLTGSHTVVECMSCHASGFAGTPTQCNSCHSTDFEQSTNPNHLQLGLSTECVTCHTTAPDWNPAGFANHNDFYPLNGAHAAISQSMCNLSSGVITITRRKHVLAVTSRILTRRQILRIRHFSFQQNVLHVILKVPGPLHPLITTINTSPSIAVHMKENGIIVLIATQIRETIANLLVSRAMLIRRRTISTLEYLVIHIIVQPAWPVIPTEKAMEAFDHNATDFPLTGAHTIC